MRNAFDAVVAEQRELTNVLIELPIVPSVVRVGLLSISELVAADGISRGGRDLEVARDRRAPVDQLSARRTSPAPNNVPRPSAPSIHTIVCSGSAGNSDVDIPRSCAPARPLPRVAGAVSRHPGTDRVEEIAIVTSRAEASVVVSSGAIPVRFCSSSRRDLSGGLLGGREIARADDDRRARDIRGANSSGDGSSG